MRMRISCQRLRVFAAAALFLPAVSFSADSLQTAMNNMFSSMTNVTAPSAYKTQRRGVISGGQITVKNRIYNTTIASFTPPSISGSCSGLDIFGGSFSFINADQFVQLLRATAANAAGYIFQLALQNVCPACHNIMQALQKVMTDLNAALGNSCQLAQGLVNDTANLLGLDAKQNNSYSLIASASGLATDAMDAFKAVSSSLSGGVASVVKSNSATASQYDEITGNVVYKALQKSSIAASLKNAGILDGTTSKDSYGIVQSITGTVIVGDLVENSDGTKSNPIAYRPPKTRLTHLLNGGEGVPVWKCSDSDCTDLTAGTTDLTAVKDKVRALLEGNDGILYKYRVGVGVSPSDEQKKLMQVMSPVLATQIRNLSVLSYETAAAQIEDISVAVAADITRQLVDDVFGLTLDSLASSKHNYRSEAVRQTKEALEAARADYFAYVQEHPMATQLASSIGQILQIANKARTFWIAHADGRSAS